MRSHPPSRNRRADRPPLPSPQSASAPRDATWDAARVTSPWGGMPSLSTSFRDARSDIPPLGLRRELLFSPGAHFAPPPERIRIEAQLPCRRVQAHLVDQLAVHSGVVEQHRSE